jgi:toxin ParE1/3/4
MRDVSFHESADAEMMEAAQYYENRAFGLGASFLDAVEEAVDKVLAEPEAYQLVGNEVRQKLLQRFPYSILYVVGDDRIRILAVPHHKRRPGYWKFRQ